MYIVKLTFNFNQPIFRQTPGELGRWGNYQFIIDKDLDMADFWVIFSEYGLIKESCKCPKENIIFIPAEGINTSVKYPQRFLDQFGKILTVQKQISGRNVVHSQNANPWFIERAYDELINLPLPKKEKKISVVSSNKDFTDGHRKRLDFVRILKDHFGDQIDVFGRGIKDFDQKWDVTAPYKFHIAIENDYCDDWVTEKFFDPILTFTYPIYYGCPNINDYLLEGSFLKIDINDPEGSIKKIEDLIENESIYNDFLKKASEYRNIYLDNLQFFPAITKLLDKIPATGFTKKNTIFGLDNLTYKARIKGKIKNLLKKVYNK
jgi:hypothetical protein